MKHFIYAAVCLILLSGKLFSQNFVTNDGGLTYYPEGEMIVNDTLPLDTAYTKSITTYELLKSLTLPNEILTDISCSADANHDGRMDVFFHGANNIHIVSFNEELNPSITQLPFKGAPYFAGDINGNGRCELIVQSGDPITHEAFLRIYESKDENSFPDSLVQEFTFMYMQTVMKINVGDFDKDNKYDLILALRKASPNPEPQTLQIYEYKNDMDKFELKWSQEVNYYSIKNKPYGDLNNDGYNEIIIPYNPSIYNDSYFTYINCWGDDRYQLASDSIHVMADGGDIQAAVVQNDYNNKPHLAIEYCHSSRGVFFYNYNQKNFELADEIHFPPTGHYTSYNSFASGDMDNDGLSEMLVFDPPMLRVVEKENGNIICSQVINEHLTRPSISDLNSDGRLDFFCQSFADETVLNIYGDSRFLLKDNVTQSTNINEDFIVLDEINVYNTLNLGENINGYLAKDGKLNIEEEGTMLLKNNVMITSYNQENKVEVNGTVQNQGTVKLTSPMGLNWGGVNLNNTLTSEFNNYTIENCNITGNVQNFSAGNSVFNNVLFQLNESQIDISNCSFNTSSIECNFVGSKDALLRLSDNSFNGNSINKPALFIESYPQFEILNNNIQNYNNDAIRIFNSGTKPNGMHLISGNSIKNNGIENNAGLLIYNSNADINNNEEISNNPYGIQSLNHSKTAIIGNPEAHYTNETQQIKNNSINQIFATAGSFPYKLSYNAIYADNLNYLINYTAMQEEKLDVTYNYWGEDFLPSNAFNPFELYSFDPVWKLEASISHTEDENLYSLASEQIDNGNYSEGVQNLHSLVETYPESKYTKAALVDLLNIEEYNTNDFNQLQSYYLTNQTLISNVELKKMAEFLANICNIKLEKYQDAINWYESIIQNPSSKEDSIFAIIDLTYIHFLNQNKGKGLLKSKFPQYQFNNKTELNTNTKKHIDMLFGGNSSNLNQNSNKEKMGLVTTNEVVISPNPFKEKINIEFKKSLDGFLEISIFDIMGIERYMHSENTKNILNKEINSENLKAGVYFIIVRLNGKTIVSEKVIKQ